MVGRGSYRAVAATANSSGATAQSDRAEAGEDSSLLTTTVLMPSSKESASFC